MTSCYCDYVFTSEKGMRSKNYYKKYLDRRINPNKIGIETDSVVYRLLFFYSELNDTIEYP
ncbi:hypothetical protein [uncultured Polaribacter sp.]|uniref:hypothetical protein n=1 Tax=uncultured Polaribacter sp. TaxID=174711 RepID=UPI00262B3D53|nr:hypothetical protein [uncultured Polaribacter sp.]